MTRNELSKLANAAADDIQSAADMSGSEPVADALNLLVNVLLSRFDQPDLTVEEAIVANYDRELVDGGNEETDDELVDRVLNWIQS